MFHQEIVSEQGLSELCHVRVIASLGEMTYAGAVWRFARKRSPQLAFAQDAKTVVIVWIVISYMFFCIFIWCHHISSYFIHHFNDTTRTEWIQVLLATSQRLRYWWHAFLFAIERVYNCCSDHGWFALVFIISSHLNEFSVSTFRTRFCPCRMIIPTVARIPVVRVEWSNVQFQFNGRVGTCWNYLDTGSGW